MGTWDGSMAHCEHWCHGLIYYNSEGILEQTNIQQPDYYCFGMTKFGRLAGNVFVQSLKSFKFVTPVKLILMYAFA